MNPEKTKDWSEANRQYLMAAVREIKAGIEEFVLRQRNPDKDIPGGQMKEAASALRENAARELPSPSSLDTLVLLLGLSSFEQKILLMCAGVELDSEFAGLVAELNGQSLQVLPSFGLAMALFRDAHWSAITPGSPLRFWQLIELTDPRFVLKSPVRIDEQILHYLTGVHTFDERFDGVAESLPSCRFLVPSHLKIAERILNSWSKHLKDSQIPEVIRLSGHEEDAAGIAAFVSGALGRTAFRMPADSIPARQKEFFAFSRLWNRESALNGYALYLDCNRMDHAEKVQLFFLRSFIENAGGLLFIGDGGQLPEINRGNILLEVPKPTGSEQVSLWQSALGMYADQLNGHLDNLVSRFDLSARTIHRVSSEFISSLSQGNPVHLPVNRNIQMNLLQLCRQHTRPRIDDLAQRIHPVADWDDIVLPEAQKEILREIAMQVNHRKRVYEDWGFGLSGTRGLGITALFTGESGTGKTMAAEVLANELQLDLYRIDLSQVVNKYIGETEKNLKKIFDAAEEGGAILLFDEADALFGKRSEVKDSHDRYGNIEVSYLLQRMEAYRGLAILTTNMKSALDKAFLRRVRFIVQFPFPGLAQRSEIWGKVFPHSTPLDHLDLDLLARLALPGGNIRNIAMNAAFLAADQNVAVNMQHILRAARTEFAKLEKTFTSLE